MIVYFTIYGPGGSYSVPDKIIVMLKDDPEWILKMIIHETIHIIIEEPFIKKFGISHWEKEYVVDGLCNASVLKKLYSNYNPQKQTKKPNLKVIKKSNSLSLKVHQKHFKNKFLKNMSLNIGLMRSFWSEA